MNFHLHDVVPPAAVFSRETPRPCDSQWLRISLLVCCCAHSCFLRQHPLRSQVHTNPSCLCTILECIADHRATLCYRLVQNPYCFFSIWNTPLTASSGYISWFLREDVQGSRSRVCSLKHTFTRHPSCLIFSKSIGYFAMFLHCKIKFKNSCRLTLQILRCVHYLWTGIDSLPLWQVKKRCGRARVFEQVSQQHRQRNTRTFAFLGTLLKFPEKEASSSLFRNCSCQAREALGVWRETASFILKDETTRVDRRAESSEVSLLAVVRQDRHTSLLSSQQTPSSGFTTSKLVLCSFLLKNNMIRPETWLIHWWLFFNVSRESCIPVWLLCREASCRKNCTLWCHQTDSLSKKWQEVKWKALESKSSTTTSNQPLISSVSEVTFYPPLPWQLLLNAFLRKSLGLSIFMSTWLTCRRTYMIQVKLPRVGNDNCHHHHHRWRRWHTQPWIWSHL